MDELMDVKGGNPEEATSPDYEESGINSEESVTEEQTSPDTDWQASYKSLQGEISKRDEELKTLRRTVETLQYYPQQQTSAIDAWSTAPTATPGAEETHISTPDLFSQPKEWEDHITKKIAQTVVSSMNQVQNSQQTVNSLLSEFRTANPDIANDAEKENLVAYSMYRIDPQQRMPVKERMQRGIEYYRNVITPKFREGEKKPTTPPPAPAHTLTGTGGQSKPHAPVAKVEKIETGDEFLDSFNKYKQQRMTPGFKF
jgi:hypothetical protein